MEIHGCKELAMSENGIRGVDLFKIAGESISGWIPSWKLGDQKPARQPFCSLMEERLLMFLEYHPQVVWYGRGDISPTFASTYKITTPLTSPAAAFSVLSRAGRSAPGGVALGGGCLCPGSSRTPGRTLGALGKRSSSLEKVC